MYRTYEQINAGATKDKTSWIFLRGILMIFAIVFAIAVFIGGILLMNVFLAPQTNLTNSYISPEANISFLFFALTAFCLSLATIIFALNQPKVFNPEWGDAAKSKSGRQKFTFFRWLVPILEEKKVAGMLVILTIVFLGIALTIIKIYG